MKHTGNSKPRVRRPLIDRAMEKVTYDHGCWLWTGAVNATGYGVLARSVGDGVGTTRLAHRAVYEALVGTLSDDAPLDHLCRNPACCNPLHLEPVTSAENTRRGIDGNAWRKALAHCPAGHEYTADNVRIRPGNRRECRECGRVYGREYMREKRAGLR